MFSNHLIQYAQEKYQQRLGLLGEMKGQITGRMEACRKEEQILMKFLYGTMPLRDSGEYDFSVFLSYVNHALMVRQTMDWCREIPEDMFLHHVLYYRVNTENIEDCRGFFYEQLKDRILGLSVREAVVEINYWCGESAAYEASDNRTISPMTVYKSGKGRCGEESTFAVTALRSVGIPARQVYTPRWAHCDDNHAWVEAFVDGSWCFFGACEPEEILNKGWFTNASSRALLVHTRTFSDYSVESAESAEECIGKDDLLVYYNDTSNYGLTKRYIIRVVDEAKKPVAGVTVSVEILNMAEYCSVVTLVTEDDGAVGLTVGLGDIHVHAMKDGIYVEGIASVKRSEELVLEFPAGEAWMEEPEGRWIDVDVEAPVDYPMHPVALTREQKAVNGARVKEANRLRENRVESYYIEEMAVDYPEERELLHGAKGNFHEIYAFLSNDGNPNRKKLLHTLSVKDYKDAKAGILEDHLVFAGDGAGMDAQLFASYVLCPRIYLEEMTAYRSFLDGYFAEEQKAAFRADPWSIWTYIQDTILFYEKLDYKTICSTPVGCLRLKQGNLLSKKLLFVAICRTLRIPARVNRVDMEAEYHDGERFVKVSGVVDVSSEKTAGQTAGQSAGKLKLSVEDASKWNYYQTWTIGVLKAGQFTTLDYTDIKFEGEELVLELEAGIYRVITTSRMPNGNQRARECTFRIRKGQIYEMSLSLREGDFSDMLVSNEIAEFDLTAPDGTAVSVTELTKDRANILAFLEEGKEPTEHVLNEMLNHQAELRRLDAQIICVVRGRDSLDHTTLSRVLRAIPQIQIYYDGFTDHVEALARRMYVDPEKLPLLVVTKPGMNGIYGCSGYNVGSVDLMVKMLG